MQGNYRADIDGLRAIAVLSVLIYHLNHGWLAGGFVGVDIFFVISGYLITKIIVEETEQGNFSFANFYARRIRRIFPALLGVLFFSAFVGWLILPAEEYKSFFQDFKYAAAQVSNFHFAREVEYLGVGVDASPLLHTWSLAVEEQFYIVWPLLIFSVLSLANKWTLKGVMLAGFFISLISCQYFLSMGDAKQAFYMFYSRAYELIIGAIIALGLLPNLTNSYLRHGTSVIGGMMIIWAFIFITNETQFPGVMAIIPALGAGLIIYSGSADRLGVINKVLTFKPLVWTGLISYSLYLWHWPVITFTQGFTGAFLTDSQAIAIAIISIALAYLSYRYIERPFRRSASDIAARQFWNINNKTVFAGLTAILLLIVAGQQFKTQQEFLGRAYDDDMLVQAKRNAAPSTLACSGGEEVQEHADVKKFIECVYGRREKTPEVLLIGDSHAMYFKETVKNWSREKGLSFQDFGVSGCSMFFSDYSFEHQKKAGKRRRICSQVSAELALRIRNSSTRPRYIFIANRNDLALFSSDVRKIVLHPNMPGVDESIEKQFVLYQQSIDSFADMKNIKIVLVGQPTVLRQSPFNCLDRQQVIPLYSLFGDVVTCPVNMEASDIQVQLSKFHERLKTLAANHQNVEYFGISDYLTELYDAQDRLLYKDNHHISKFTTEFITPHLVRELN